MDFNIGKPSHDGTVKITVPASVAFNGELFEANVRQLVKHFGCAACHSGKDYRYILAKDYLVDEKLELKPLRPNFLEAGPEAAPASAALRVGLTTKQGSDINVIIKVIDKIRKNFGCAPCHSGLDLHFRGEIEQLTQNVIGQ